MAMKWWYGAWTTQSGKHVRWSNWKSLHMFWNIIYKTCLKHVETLKPSSDVQIGTQLVGFLQLMLRGFGSSLPSVRHGEDVWDRIMTVWQWDLHHIHKKGLPRLFRESFEILYQTFTTMNSKISTLEQQKKLTITITIYFRRLPHTPSPTQKKIYPPPPFRCAFCVLAVTVTSYHHQPCPYLASR